MLEAVENEAEAAVQGIVTPRALVVVVDDRA
ncbi:MAG: molybdenum cofactor biosynthesis protein, partial [Gordonia sp.]|nr:molybdenum cofactor biosynthesis protein [Gordonia sp. (in: high G+C Gram-positive bacteria)]